MQKLLWGKRKGWPFWMSSINSVWWRFMVFTASHFFVYLLSTWIKSLVHGQICKYFNPAWLGLKKYVNISIQHGLAWKRFPRAPVSLVHFLLVSKSSEYSFSFDAIPGTQKLKKSNSAHSEPSHIYNNFNKSSLIKLIKSMLLSSFKSKVSLKCWHIWDTFTTVHTWYN